MTPDAIRAAILLGTPVLPGVYDLGDGCELNVYIDGVRAWFRNGNLHREDGPAIQVPDGKGHWYRNGEPVAP